MPSRDVQDVSHIRRLAESVDWQDGENVSKGSFLLIAEMRFPDIETMERAISSPERKRAREDFDKFPPFHGHVWHQATRLRHINIGSKLSTPSNNRGNDAR